jgi:hypothetical protein
LQNKPDRTGNARQGARTFQWELDSRDSGILFKLARESAQEHVRKYRMRLIELEHFDPQPERYDLHTGSFEQFDNRTREDSIEDLKRWIVSYERVAQFCLKMEAMILHYEAEQFGEQMAELFGRKP